MRRILPTLDDNAMELRRRDVTSTDMVGSSLAMAPAVLLAQGALYCDLDAPLLLSQDRENPLDYDAQGVHPPARALWG